MSALNEIMDVAEACERWGLKPTQVKEYCRQGIVQARKLNNGWVLLIDQPSPAQPDHPKNWRTAKSKK